MLVGQLTSNASRWCFASKYQHPFDADLPAIIELLSIMHRFAEAIRNVGFEVKILLAFTQEFALDDSVCVGVEKEPRVGSTDHHI